MLKPNFPHNEAERIRAIQQLGIIYSPSEAQFDRITRLVCRHFEIETALVTIVYKEIQWFKSVQGLNACSTDREVSFCGHAILADDLFIIENALLDERFMDNPLVVDAPKIRFYAGQPLKDAYGVVIGTLCIFDSVPRSFSQEDRRDLRDFARLIESELSKSTEDNVVSRFIQSLTETQRSMMIDPIVGSWNRRGFEALLGKEIENAAREKSGLSLIHVKLDSFDLLMSRFGHDRIFDFSKFTASIIRDLLPKGSSIGSVGVDAFVAVCSGMTEKEVARLIVNLKESFANNTLETIGIKVLVDVEITSLVLTDNDLKLDAVRALDRILAIS